MSVIKSFIPKFRTAHDGVRYNRPTTFNYIVPEYQWSDELQRPVVVGKVDLKEQIQQYADCALDRVLKKFLPEEDIPKYLGDLIRSAKYVDSDEPISEDSPDYKNLAVLADLYEKAEDYREKFDLSDDLSVSDIYKIVGDHAQKMGKGIQEYLDKNKQAGSQSDSPPPAEEVQK